jgi:hypothetical protein
MTLELGKIWEALNKFLTRLNIFLLQVTLMSGFDPKKMIEKKIPIGFNILLLLVLCFIIFIMTYGAYRQSLL